MKPGLLIVAELTGAVAARIHAFQERFDPRMAAELPPHVTLVGSSGMGPMPMRIPVEELTSKLAPIAATTAPMSLHFGAPLRFMQSRIVVLPMDPHGPLRELHERIKTSGLPYDPPRFAFTPHCTLNFYRELPDDELRQVLAVRINEPVTIDRLRCYQTLGLTQKTLVLEVELTGETRGAVGSG